MAPSPLQSPDRGRIQSSSSSLFGRLGSLRKVKKQMDDERSQGFVVQYCGHQTVPRQDGLEMVKEVIQQLAVPKLSSSTASPAHLVEFDVSPSGISLTDPQKKFFGRKHFSTKSITYVLRIRYAPHPPTITPHTSNSVNVTRTFHSFFFQKLFCFCC